MRSFGYQLYRSLVEHLPGRFVNAIGRSTLLRPLRERLLRKDGISETKQGLVKYEGMSFVFSAPYQTFHKAESRGIERRITRLAMSILQEGDIAIDAGSNYGFITLVMAKSVGASGHVFSFEIDQRIGSILESTLRANSMEGQVSVIKQGLAASAVDGMVTVDSILGRNGHAPVTFMKVDVDGDDYDVLKGARETLRHHKPVVVVEMEKNQQEIYSYLAELGYTHFIGMSNEIVRPGQWPPNLIASTTAVRIPRVAKP